MRQAPLPLEGGSVVFNCAVSFVAGVRPHWVVRCPWPGIAGRNLIGLAYVDGNYTLPLDHCPFFFTTLVKALAEWGSVDVERFGGANALVLDIEAAKVLETQIDGARKAPRKKRK